MKKLIILLALPVIFCSVYAHTHNNAKFTRETKIIAITILAEARGEGEKGMYAVAAVVAQRAFDEKGRHANRSVSQALPIQLLERQKH